MKTIKFSLILLAFMAFAQTTWAQSYNTTLPCLPSHGETDDQSAWCGETQTIALAAGYNWFSTNLNITLSELEAALVEALPNAASIKISAQNGGTCTYNGTRWRVTGGFTWDVSQMYIIQCPSACTLTLTGLLLNPTEHPVTIVNGYNWIGFPLNTSMSVTDAFAQFGVANDKVTNQAGDLSTCNGTRWRNPFNLEPGKGYIYNSASSSSRTFIFPIPVGDKNGRK